MADYEAVLSLILSFSDEQLEALIELLTTAKRANIAIEKSMRRSRLTGHKKLFQEAFEKLLEETTPANETPEQLELRKREVKQYLEENVF
jgi:hypothetical protein